MASGCCPRQVQTRGSDPRDRSDSLPAPCTPPPSAHLRSNANSAAAAGGGLLARDTRLDRQVAIAALPAHHAQDSDRLASFQPEAA